MEKKPTPDQLQGVMLFVADPAYWGALERGESRAAALRAAVEAAMTACLSGEIPEHRTGDPILMRREATRG